MCLLSVTMFEQELQLSITQRIVIKFFAQDGVRSAKIFGRLKPQFGDKILKKTHLYEWYKKCLKKQKAVENEAHQPC